ncbi:MAG: hypothetical protein Kow0081_3520 [Candidatus Dojkabacteria bacterium]
MTAEQRKIFKSLNKKLALAILLMLAAFFLVQFYLTASTGASNSSVELIRRERDELRLENEILSAEIDKIQSLPSIDELKSELLLEEKYVDEIVIDGALESVALR